MLFQAHILQIGASAQSLSEKFNISVSSIYLWLGTLGMATTQEGIIGKDKEDLLREIAELKRQVKLLKFDRHEAKVNARDIRHYWRL